MYTQIREVPFAPSSYDFIEDCVMIHNLSQPVDQTTQKIKLGDFISAITTKVKIKYVELEESKDIQDISFELNKGELFFVKIKTKTNDQKTSYDGYKLYLFVKNEIGKFKGSRVDPSVEGEVVTESDFVGISNSVSSKNIVVEELIFDGGFFKKYLESNEDNVFSALKELASTSTTKYEAPILEMTWGAKDKQVDIVRAGLPALQDGTESVRNQIAERSRMCLLNVKLRSWEKFSEFIGKGGVIKLLIFKRRGAKTNPRNKTIQKLSRRWSFDKKAEEYGGVNSISITKESDWYDIRPEFLLKEGIGNRRKYLDKSCSIKREKLGFALSFEYKGEKKQTSILKQLDLILYDTGAETNRPHLITFRDK